MAYRPSSDLEEVKQIVKDANDNETCIPMQLYFTNIMIAMNCMGKGEYEVDAVTHTVNHMELAVKAEMESSYSDHTISCPCDAVTKIRAIQQSLIKATAAEKKVLNTRNLVAEGRMQVMMGLPVGNDTVRPAHGV